MKLDSLSPRGFIIGSMSIAAVTRMGVFRPLEEVKGASRDAVYPVFSEEELRSLQVGLAWLKAAESSFDYWNNEADAVYHSL